MISGKPSYWLCCMYLSPEVCRRGWLFLCPSVLFAALNHLLWVHIPLTLLCLWPSFPSEETSSFSCCSSNLLDLMLCCFFLCCGVCVCNPTMTGTSVSNLDLINCCFQFLRVKWQQVTVCTSLQPPCYLTALDLHQSWSFFFSEHFVLLPLLSIHYFRKNKK